MQVKFYCDSGANVYSRNESDWIDTSELGYTDEEWEALSPIEKHKEAELWAWDYGLEIWYEEKTNG